MDFTPLFNEIMKAGPWALMCLLIIWLAWTLFGALANWIKPVVASVVEAHLRYLKDMSEGQVQIHAALDNQTKALEQNNEVLIEIKKQETEKLKILSDHSLLLTKISTHQDNHSPKA